VNGKIRIGIISSAREVGAELVRYFRKYMPQFEAVFEWGTDAADDIEKLLSKLVSTRTDILVASSKAEAVWEKIKKIKCNSLLNIKVVLLADDTTADEVTRLSALADSVFFKYDDFVVLCKKIDELCDGEFVRNRERILSRLDIIAEEILAECFFSRISAGSGYLKKGMLLCCYNPQYLDCLSALYYAVEHDAGAVSEKTVEKCMRSAVHLAEKKYLEYEAKDEAQKTMPFVNIELCETIFKNKRVTVGKVLPFLVDELMKRIEGKRVNDENSCA
jgi:hypothetical protein